VSSRPFVSVKFSPAGRTVSFLLPDIIVDEEPPASGPIPDPESLIPDPGSPNVDPASPAPDSGSLIPDPGTPIADPGPLIPGDRVIVHTLDGQALGTITRVPSALAERREPPADSPHVVVRRASEDDVIQRLKQQQRELDAHRVAQLKIRERGLPMKLTKVEQTFDASRIIFYYTSESRVDFRELVRDLAAHFRTRIEMRQIGVRDEAKILGGYGSCGRPLCCTTWLRSFEPVSIKMAKQQDLSLNPSKLSGQCGRLKCCLRYELPNGNGVKRGGCADHGTCSNPTGPGGCGSCGSGGCGSCHG
jgi:cell fate regulator YaaT (PSP1 superfamily)